jgi:hypothetical protein
MRLRYLTKSPRSGERYPRHVVQGEPEFCCDDVKYYWEDVVGLGVRGKPEPFLSVRHVLSDRGPLYDEVSIRFCPFCGAEIQAEELLV